MRISDWSSYGCSSDLSGRTEVESAPMPDIRQMARRAARCKEHHVDSHVVARFREVVEQDFRRRGDPRKAAFVDGEVEIGAGGAGLHLDKGEHPAAPGDQVDLSGGRAHTAADDLPALRSEEHTSEL